MTISLSRSDDYSLLLELAVEAAFDWVYYAANDFIQLSVIPTSMLIFQSVAILYSYNNNYIPFNELLWAQIGGSEYL